MPKRIEIKIGKNKETGLVGMLFEAPTQQIILPAENALEIARQLILAAKECADYKELKTIMREIEKETQQ